MPNGCNHDGEGDFGDCCGSDGKCGSWAFGPNAEDVEWPEMPITGIWYFINIRIAASFLLICSQANTLSMVKVGQ